MSKRTIKEEIEHCLQKYPETRNSDITLTIKVWEEFYSEVLFDAPHNGKSSINVLDLFNLPREDNVKRVRAKFTELGKYLPTSWEVAKQRQIEEGRWREYVRTFGIENVGEPMYPPPPPPKPKVETCEHGLPTFVSCPNCKPV